MKNLYIWFDKYGYKFIYAFLVKIWSYNLNMIILLWKIDLPLKLTISAQMLLKQCFSW